MILGLEQLPKQKINNLVIYLIKPSRYDNEGYVVRHFKGVLPSNTLACLYGLTEDVRENGSFGKDLTWKTEIIDETVQKVETNKIIRHAKKKDTKVIVCLVGVQSNQFPRASDLALEFQKNGVQVLIGGFHVSGSVAMLGGTPPEIQKLIDSGVTVILGEVEGKWEPILQDAYNGTLKSVYNFLLELPNLNFSPLPRINKRYLSNYAWPNFGTLDCGRGCPFNCSFCTVINVQGRAMRFRDVELLTNLLRENYYKNKISFYFFTDDNFSRNKNWKLIFESLIKLRSEEKIPIEFMIQVDTLSYKIPDFVELAKKAGCTQVFIGMESLNAQNLASAGKKQNKIEEFKDLINSYRRAKINTHTGYIVGFPFDTVESIEKDIEQLKNELGPEQVSFFILTPLPGSQDHKDLVLKGDYMDPDLNSYDSFHVTTHHPNMTKEELEGAYTKAWVSFYNVENMKAILKRVSRENYWGVFRNLLWYKNATMVEGGHPMIEGFVRIKDRCQKRPGSKIEPLFQHFIRRFKDAMTYIKLWHKLILEMEEVWLHTRHRSALEEQIVQVLQDRYKNMKEWRNLKLANLQKVYCRAVIGLQKASENKVRLNFPIPSRFVLWLMQRNLFLHSLTYTRKPLEEFWRKTQENFLKGHLHRINISKLLSTTLQEWILFTSFSYAFCGRLIPFLLFRGLNKTKAAA